MLYADGGDAEATAVVRIGGLSRAVDLVVEPGRLFRWPCNNRSSSLRGSSTDVQLADDFIAEGAPTLNEVSPAALELVFLFMT